MQFALHTALQYLFRFKGYRSSKTGYSGITHSFHSKSKPVLISFFCGTQKMVFWRMLATKSLCFSLTSIEWTKKSIGAKTVWLSTFFKIPSFVFSRSKEMHKGWVNNDDIIQYSFWVDYLSRCLLGFHWVSTRCPFLPVAIRPGTTFPIILVCSHHLWLHPAVPIYVVSVCA